MKNKSEAIDNKIFHYLSMVGVAENGMTDVEVLRVGTIQDRGFKITQAMLDEFVKNFKDNVYGTEVQVNLEHYRGSEAAGWIKDLFTDGPKLFARVEWTEMGQNKIDKKLFKFVSAELASEYPHHETGKLFNNVFIGLALTNTPALKGQQPLTLSESVINLISKNMFAKLLEEMKKRKFVSKEDKAMVKSLLEELPAEEQEAQKEAVAEVDAKPEVAEKTEEEKAAEAKAQEEADAKAAADKAEAEKQELAEKNGKTVSLAEFNDVKSKLDAMELKEFMGTSLILSDKLATGFTGGADTEKELKSFLIGLSQAQRLQFAQLVAKVVTVDLSVHGSTSVGNKENKEFADQVVELSEKLLSEGKAKTITEAQKMATEELNSKK